MASNADNFSNDSETLSASAQQFHSSLLDDCCPSVKVQNMGVKVYVVLCLFLDNSDSPSIVEQ